MADTDPHLVAMVKGLAPYAPGAAGVVLSLLFAEGLTVRGKLATGFGGLAAVKWVAPALCVVVNPFVPGDSVPVEVANLVGFATGCFGMILMTGLAKALAKYASDPLKLVRMQLGPVSIGGGE
ncbi:MAG: hypothetical protein KA105_02880 [Caulobacter sp.]|nr:hypothetical protein [Caulobacter sp.]